MKLPKLPPSRSAFDPGLVLSRSKLCKLDSRLSLLVVVVVVVVIVVGMVGVLVVGVVGCCFVIAVVVVVGVLLASFCFCKLCIQAVHCLVHLGHCPF